MPNNLKFLKRIMADDIFKKGEYDTGYIPQNIDSLLKKDDANDPFNITCSVIARNHTLSKANPLPGELFNFRNVRNTTHKHIINVS